MSVTSFTAGNGDQLDVLHTLGGVVIATHDHPNCAPVAARLEPQDDAAFMARILKARGIEPFSGADFGRALVRGVTYNQALAYALRFLEHAEAIETSRRKEEEKRTQKLKRRQEHERNRQRNALVSELMQVTRSAPPGELIHKPIAAFIEDNYTRTTGQPNLEDEIVDAEVFVTADLDGFQAALLNNAEKLAAQTATPPWTRSPRTIEAGDFEPTHDTRWTTSTGYTLEHDGTSWTLTHTGDDITARYEWGNIPTNMYPLTEAA